MLNTFITNLEEEAFCYLVLDFDSAVERDTLWKVFGEFGVVKQIEIKKGTQSKAAVIYNSEPSSGLLSQRIYIQNRLVAVSPLPVFNYISDFCVPLTANKLSFGGLHSPTEFVEEWTTNQYVSLNINTNEQYLEIFFLHLGTYYRMRYVYDDSLRNNAILQRFDNITSLTLSAKYPAYFWKSKVPFERLSDSYYLANWERITEIPLDDFSRDMIQQRATVGTRIDGGPVLPGGQYTNYLVKLNLWTVYRLEFDIPAKSSKGTRLSATHLTHEALEHKLNEAIGARNQPKAEQIIVRPPTKTVHFVTQISNMPFEVQYMMEHAFYLKILRDYNVNTGFFEKMRDLPPQVACVFLTLLSAYQQRVYNPETMVNHIYKFCKDQIGFQMPIPEDCTLQRRVIVTPTSVYPLQPVIEPMNQLQYHFRQYADRFLYVQFTDEDLNPILPLEDNSRVDFASDEPQNAALYSRIYAVLRRGLQIAGKTYEFLGTSIQDLRNHGCWFFSPTDTVRSATILNWMGDFREIDTIASFVNCTGQALAPRLMSMEINPSDVEEIDDYIHNSYNYTMDCGKMSPQIAREIAKQLDIGYTPSVVKFNFNGARGILMLSNFLSKQKIQLRSSQIRFESDRMTLEIIKYSKPNKVYLNSRSITLLGSLGVRNYVFQELLEESLSYYEKYSDVDMVNDYYAHGQVNDFRSILNAKFLEKRDPFIMNLMISYQNSILREIKKESKIYIHNGVRVFAIMDETGSLGPGEVFLQVADSSGLSSSRRIVEGPCVIYRESSCFPGDVRVLHAINCSKLRHYSNVLVYSSHDLRDLPNSCSNDDPDEDNFNVIWDLRLLPPKHNLSPRKYETRITPNTVKNVGFKEAARFVTSYISEDKSPLLKESYIAIADRYPEGILNGNCLYLSHQISRALDFVKTGVYATLSDDLVQIPYPDFMQQNQLRTYTSYKPLGLIYRSTRRLNYQPFATNHCTYDPRLHVEDMYKYILDARKTKAKYDHSLRVLLGRYSVRTEVEFISGYILEFPKYLSESQHPEFCNNIRQAYKQFRSHWQEMFDMEFGSDEDLKWEQVEAKAAAWYYVTYHPSEFKSDVIYNSAMFRYMSFPWVVDEYLVSLAQKNNDRPVSDKYVQAVPPEKIVELAKTNTGHLADVVFASDSEDDDDEDEDNEDGDDEDSDEDVVIDRDNHLHIDSYGIHLVDPHEGHNNNEDEGNEDNDEVPSVTVKLANLLNL